mgnify:FL=1
MDFAEKLAKQFHLQKWQTEKVIELIDEGNTIPFIARYRKEAHGSLDDQTLRKLAERLDYLRSLEKRRAEVSSAIEESGAMTGKISEALNDASTLAEIEDIYRPFRPKRRTRASVAKEKGLQPLADAILRQEENSPQPDGMAEKFVNPEKGVETPDDALAGALDIIAEHVSDSASIRRRLRVVTGAQGMLASKAAKPDEDSVYAQYYDFREQVSKIAGHRVLAINRGEKEGFLKVSVELDHAKGMNIVLSETLKGNGSPCEDAVRQACEDAYNRLVFPAIERDIRGSLTEEADKSAINVFSVNLRNLLMQPPVKGCVTMGLDPGYRTGCKVAVVDPTGRVLDTGVIYPTHSKTKVQEAKKTVKCMIKKHHVTVIAIGNGTASRETEQFAAEVIKEIGGGVSYVIVNEAGASVYSASKLAAQEFPEYDVTLRSAVSIARRLQDPLAELVKIDPQAIGVGQYQHDMPKKQLDEALSGVVEDCVNTVGVDLNTASPSLLGKVAGMTPSVSKNVVKYREENGAFHSRQELMKVPKLGPKAFQQCAGFLRVPESSNILDHTAVHPESYGAARSLLELCGYGADDIAGERFSSLKSRLENVGGIKEAAEKTGAGVPTLSDIVSELMQPGRDPRDELPKPILRTDVMKIDDLKPGMELTGTVRNVVDFGAFVDIGVHQDGLVHVSQISDSFVKNPADVLKVGDIVKVRVLSVDVKKQRISLTMKKQFADH